MAVLSALTLQNVLRLREPLGAVIRGYSPTLRSGSCLSESHLPVCFPVKKQPCNKRCEWFRGSGLSSDKQMSFSTPSVLGAPFSLPTDSWAAPFTCRGATEVLLLSRCLSCLNGMKDRSSCCGDSGLPPGTTESVQGRIASSVTFLPCSCCLWLSCFKATLPVCVMGIPSPQPPMSNLWFHSSVFFPDLSFGPW